MNQRLGDGSSGPLCPMLRGLSSDAAGARWVVGGRRERRSQPPFNVLLGAVTILLRPQEEGLSTALALFLTKQGCPAKVVGPETVAAELPHELHREQARMEIDLYVRLWQALHGVRVDVVED
jgi:hypothetical protein